MVWAFSMIKSKVTYIPRAWKHFVEESEEDSNNDESIDVGSK